MGLSRRLFLTSTTLFGAAVVAGCATTVSGRARPNPADLRRVRESALPEVVNVAVIAFEPFTVQDGGDLSGPVPDIARKVLTDLGVQEVKFTVVREQAQVSVMVAAGRLEMAGGMLLRPDLCDQLVYSAPDHVSGTAFAVPAGNPKGLKTFADVIAKGAKVSVLTGAPEDQDAAGAGVPAENIVRLIDPTDLLADVRSGRADCFAFDDITVRHIVKNEGEGLEVAEAFLPDKRLPYVGAYAFPLDSPLVEPFNDKLRELHDSGEWLRMVEPFGFGEANEPAEDLAAELPCAG
jgi:polar amino acid transport system substrate-binding protein